MHPDGDPVAASVAAYRDHVDAYRRDHADEMSDALARFAARVPCGAVVLDAGCGPGRDLERLRACGLHPVGVDLSAAFAAVAPGPVVQGDLRALPLATASVGGVWACASLVHLPEEDAAAALGELARVGAPGAPASVSVKCAGPDGWADTAHGRRWFRRWDPDAFASLVTACGFDVLGVHVGAVFVDVDATRRTRPEA